MKRHLLALTIAIFAAAPAFASDWPHWLGPNGNGSSPGDRPADHLARGRAEGAVEAFRRRGLFHGRRRQGHSAITQVQHDGAEHVLALDAVKGTKLWEDKDRARSTRTPSATARAARRPSKASSVYVYSQRPARLP